MSQRLLPAFVLLGLVAVSISAHLVVVPFTDCNGNGISDERDIYLGTSVDCDVDGVPDECQIAAGGCYVDCNQNGVLDWCELCDGGGFGCGACCDDCDCNGLPDDCEIVDGRPDCNDNGILDDCEFDGGSNDCNNNGVLDECESLGPWASTYCPTSTNSVGAGALLELVVGASSCDTLVFTCRDLPPLQIGLCISSLSLQSPGVPFGNGTRCVGLSGLSRLTDIASTQSGQVYFSVSLTDPRWGGAGPGDHRYLQFYYRDPAAGGAGFNLSNAIDLTFPLY